VNVTAAVYNELWIHARTGWSGASALRLGLTKTMDSTAVIAMPKTVTLEILPSLYAVSRLDAAASIPAWADGAGFVSISRTRSELSIVCLQERVPEEVVCSREWIALEFAGPFAFDETGIVASVVNPLSEVGIGVFVISTYDGDHLLVKQLDLARVRTTLTGVGHGVRTGLY
jgi:uncharacterized protein